MLNPITSINAPRISALIRGTGIRARLLRGTSWTVAGYGVSQMLRLISNLILARLLAPEIFGVMALINMLLFGLAMLSDTGINAVIIQHERGNDKTFLDTAWTIQVCRGVLLFFVTAILAFPISIFYAAPELSYLLPVAGLTSVVSAFYPTKLSVANRELMLGRITLVEITCQIVSLVVSVTAAVWLKSAWALLPGWIIATLCQLYLSNIWIPGPANRFCWDTVAAKEVFKFGRWIFLGSASAFLITQGDRAFLGRYLTLENLGLYNIGYTLGCLPGMLATTISYKILFPLYKQIPPEQSRQNWRQIFYARSALTTAFLSLGLVLAFIGPNFVSLLYPDAYSAAGAVVTLIAVASIPKIVINGCESSILAAGNSKQFTGLVVLLGCCQMLLYALLIPPLGIVGVAISQFVAPIVYYPFLAATLRKQGSWMPIHDAVFAFVASIAGGIAIYVHSAANVG